jgi:hypothetical protein
LWISLPFSSFAFARFFGHGGIEQQRCSTPNLDTNRVSGTWYHYYVTFDNTSGTQLFRSTVAIIPTACVAAGM